MSTDVVQEKRYRIFHYPKDDDWIVCVEDETRPMVLLGVADCPDEKTARAVLQGLQWRTMDHPDRCTQCGESKSLAAQYGCLAGFDDCAHD